MEKVQTLYVVYILIYVHTHSFLRPPSILLATSSRGTGKTSVCVQYFSFHVLLIARGNSSLSIYLSQLELRALKDPG